MASTDNFADAVLPPPRIRHWNRPLGKDDAWVLVHYSVRRTDAKSISQEFAQVKTRMSLVSLAPFFKSDQIRRSDLLKLPCADVSVAFVRTRRPRAAPGPRQAPATSWTVRSALSVAGP
jgi:hypothetical protein